MLLGKCSSLASVVGTRGRLPPVLPPTVASWSTEALLLPSEVLTNVVRKPLVQMFAEFKASVQNWSMYSRNVIRD